MTIHAFLNLSEQEQKELLFKCCGCNSWVEKLATKFPFNSLEELKNESDKIWFSLDEKNWREAFTHHPKIGNVESLKNKFASTANWASDEQLGVKSADSQVLVDLKTCNDEYEEKFGFIFIVCATGKSADEMLSILKQRLQNTPGEEIKIAIHEQNKITHLRLEKLFA